MKVLILIEEYSSILFVPLLLFGLSMLDNYDFSSLMTKRNKIYADAGKKFSKYSLKISAIVLIFIGFFIKRSVMDSEIISLEKMIFWFLIYLCFVMFLIFIVVDLYIILKFYIIKKWNKN